MNSTTQLTAMFRGALIALCLMPLLGYAQAPSQASTPTSVPIPEQSSSTQTPVKEAPSADYRLGAGDDIRITVFQNPDLLLETRVSESGTVNYPLIGAIKIGGLSTNAAERKIAQGLRDGGFVKQPQVNIQLVAIRGNQVSVLGLVNKPGRFPLDTTTRVSDAIALAGGIEPTGSDTAVLSGTRDGQPFRKEIDIPSLFGKESSPDDLILQGGDVVYIHKAPVFYLYGEAQKPGSYRIERGMTVQQALAAGGGPTSRGTEWHLRLDRRGPDGKVVRLTPERDELVQPDDVLYVRESLF